MSLRKDIEALEAQQRRIEDRLKQKRKEFAKHPPTREEELAEELHDMLCHVNWSYESYQWQEPGYARKMWLEKARCLIKKLDEFGLNDQVFLDLMNVLIKA